MTTINPSELMKTHKNCKSDISDNTKENESNVFDSIKDTRPY